MFCEIYIFIYKVWFAFSLESHLGFQLDKSKFLVSTRVRYWKLTVALKLQRWAFWIFVAREDGILPNPNFDATLLHLHVGEQINLGFILFFHICKLNRQWCFLEVFLQQIFIVNLLLELSSFRFFWILFFGTLRTALIHHH